MTNATKWDNCYRSTAAVHLEEGNSLVSWKRLEWFHHTDQAIARYHIKVGISIVLFTTINGWLNNRLQRPTKIQLLLLDCVLQSSSSSTEHRFVTQQFNLHLLFITSSRNRISIMWQVSRHAEFYGLPWRVQSVGPEITARRLKRSQTTVSNYTIQFCDMLHNVSEYDISTWSITM